MDVLDRHNGRISLVSPADLASLSDESTARPNEYASSGSACRILDRQDGLVLTPRSRPKIVSLTLTSSIRGRPGKGMDDTALHGVGHNRERTELPCQLETSINPDF